MSQLYDRLGPSYEPTRRPDPRIAGMVQAAIGHARSIINVGAGTGSYEPDGRHVVAVEPSAAMRSGRPASAAPCVAAGAEALPFDDASVDLVMGVYTDFHWSDRARGVAEMVRVARNAVVLLTVDSAAAENYWLIRDYFPSGRDLFASLDELLALLPDEPEVWPVPIPEDCRDGFVQAFWKRPHELLDPAVRSSMALFAAWAQRNSKPACGSLPVTCGMAAGTNATRICCGNPKRTWDTAWFAGDDVRELAARTGSSSGKRERDYVPDLTPLTTKLAARTHLNHRRGEYHSGRGPEHQAA